VGKQAYSDLERRLIRGNIGPVMPARNRLLIKAFERSNLFNDGKNRENLEITMLKNKLPA
jgi:hypothetical protein